MLSVVSTTLSHHTPSVTHLDLILLEPLTQIVGGVALLLSGVLNLLGRLVSETHTTRSCLLYLCKNDSCFVVTSQLSGLGLDSLLKGIVAAMGLDKIYSGLGLNKWLNTK